MTKKYISLSKFPGKQGLRVYTAFFKYYGIDATYTPLGTEAIDGQLELAKGQGVAGISVSMPFKEQVIEYLDWVDPLVLRYNSCNTVIIEDGEFNGYNSDYYGIAHLLKYVSPYQTVSLLGAGSMGSMVKAMLDKQKVDLWQFSRRLKNWSERYQGTSVLINCTSMGTQSPKSPMRYIPKSVELVIDLAITPGDLFHQCQNTRVKYITGQEMYKYQFLKQFELYTGITSSSEEYDKILNDIQI